MQPRAALMLKIGLASILLGILVVTVACGAGNTDEKEIGRIFRIAESSRIAGDYARIHSLLSPSSRANCPLGDFLGLFILAKAFGWTPIIESPDVHGTILAITVNGDTAIVTETFAYTDGRPYGGGMPEETLMVREQGRWWWTLEDGEDCKISWGGDG